MVNQTSYKRPTAPVNGVDPLVEGQCTVVNQTSYKRPTAPVNGVDPWGRSGFFNGRHDQARTGDLYDVNVAL